MDRRAGDAHPPAGPERRWRPALPAVIALGCLIRAWHVLRSDFPLNDGGLFYAMVRDLQAAGYALPATTSYNGEGIAFGYSPLAFYVAAAFDALTPVSLEDVLRVLPLLATCLSIVAFVRLARSILGPGPALIPAVLAFAVVPRAYTWLIMGGGLTRSFGFLFAILAIHAAHRLYVGRRWRHAVLMGVFAGLVVLSHVGTAPFVASSIGLFFLFYGRHARGVLGSALGLAVAVAVVTPWFLTVTATHGVEPVLAAFRSGSNVFTDPGMRYHVKQLLARFAIGSTGEALFPVVYVLALAGAVAAVIRGRYLLPLWWVTILVFDARAGWTYATLPVAMLAGLGVGDALIPLLRGAVAGRGKSPRWHRIGALGALLAYTIAASVVDRVDFGGEARDRQPLTPAQRADMGWVARATPPSSRFLVVSGEPWFTDRAAEWFPVLADRRSVATVQGSEWIPGAFHDRIEAAEKLRGCGSGDDECLEGWATEWNVAYTHVFVMDSTEWNWCCRRLIRSLNRSPAYRQVHAGEGGWVFEKIGKAPLPKEFFDEEAVRARREREAEAR